MIYPRRGNSSVLAVTLLLSSLGLVSSFGLQLAGVNIQSSLRSKHTTRLEASLDGETNGDDSLGYMDRRYLLLTGLALATACQIVPSDANAQVIKSSTIPPSSSLVMAVDDEPRITDKIFLTIKGLPASSGLEEGDNKIVIGLYGDRAPSSVAKIKALVTYGLPTPCKPKAERTLQKEQLEANKVYNSCKEGEEQGVLLRYSTVWRVITNLRVDLGAVTGKFVSREFPDWNEEKGTLPIISQGPGIVSVRRGTESGFGMAICTGKSEKAGLEDLDQNHIVVGKVLQGMNVVQALNNVPVITTAKQVNYMAVAGGNLGSNAPNRSCRYGGPMYCNENKPLVKLTVTEVGLL
mmetsp:Transcript_12353/g.16185  ORF Transcript_12353/g.16185 Transcript_12353/m.16185 type:complete len:350 (+) Transcript_12353:44-1093(+)